MVFAINAYSLPVNRYSSSVLKWPVSELQYLVRRTRKLLTMSRALCPKADVDRLYLPRSQGRGRMGEELRFINNAMTKLLLTCTGTFVVSRK